MHVLAHVFVIEVHGTCDFIEGGIPIPAMTLEIDLFAQRVFHDQVVTRGKIGGIDAGRLRETNVRIEILKFIVANVGHRFGDECTLQRIDLDDIIRKHIDSIYCRGHSGFLRRTTRAGLPISVVPAL
jgi:hypothetical protein